ncbi:hypothetical protein J2S09_001925 [Bacillus fengqiuensis]|nr:hypothetical protein [Bacillus fengqiuensis]
MDLDVLLLLPGRKRFKPLSKKDYLFENAYGSLV